MKSKRLHSKSKFQVLLTNRRGQAAEMTLRPGGAEGGPDNRHRGADQWMFIVSGTGEAIVNERRKKLKAGMVVLIEKGDTHEIRNTGRTNLKTINLYVPPAYTEDGDELARGKK